ncbi:hypothetical protein HGRIS_004983 [Hohenbuehelia grisea]|uniref:F-box domain-containing protein n=1 Tax=Hohenbuehelia grisea TaxID=104357 RepID=A0ABR3JEX7_9AGAR
MVELPTEIWTIIASHIPDHYFMPLLSLNRVFLKLAMDKRYGTVDLSCDNSETHRFIDFLKNDYAADAVHTLLLSNQLREVLIRQERIDRSRWLRGLSCLITCTSTRLPKPFALYPIYTQKSSKQIAKEVDEVLLKLRNVKHLTAAWDNCTSDDVKPHSRAWPARAAGLEWSGFAAGLETLRLRISALFLPVLFQHVAWPENLGELSIEILYPLFAEPIAPAVLMNVFRCVSSLINKLHRLKSLAITLGWPVDFSSLFLSLGKFPELRNLSLHLPLYGLHLSDTCGLLRFVREHADIIENFTLHLKGCGRPSLGWDAEGASEYCSQILRQSLPRLTSLDLDLGALRRPSEADVFLAKFGTAKLRSVRIRGLVMSLGNLHSLSRSFPHDAALRHLTVQVASIGKALFDLLSQSFPHLHSLCLVASGIAYWSIVHV